MRKQNDRSSLWKSPPPSADEMAEAQLRYRRIMNAIDELSAKVERRGSGTAAKRRLRQIREAFDELVTSPAWLLAMECSCGHDVRIHFNFTSRLGPTCHACLDEGAFRICALSLKPS